MEADPDVPGGFIRKSYEADGSEAFPDYYPTPVVGDTTLHTGVSYTGETEVVSCLV
jgi:hypothetical protein